MKALLEAQIQTGTYQLKDILDKIDTFWAVGKIRAEDRIKLTDEIIEEYVAGKWYHNGDHILYNDKVYMCANVPENNVCVWNPDEMPSYWTLVKPFTPETSATEEEPTETVPQHEGVTCDPE